ncbi:unnamed protein product [Protopolystoma xenopodis]|uniref:Uncharacterized protein n=1 Tax=Protopolystoma xenopodis TaxID=117903 RepID=A0A3S5CS44_9PLAT|nr:unnamed protein product [Protopolystoma xenopodis]
MPQCVSAPLSAPEMGDLVARARETSRSPLQTERCVCLCACICVYPQVHTHRMAGRQDVRLDARLCALSSSIQHFGMREHLFGLAQNQRHANKRNQLKVRLVGHRNGRTLFISDWLKQQSIWPRLILQ